MTIKFQVVGIFVNVDLELDGNTTVKAVMDFASTQASTGNLGNIKSFGYRDDGKSVSAFYAEYKKDFVGRVIGHNYHAGKYYLAENTNTKPSYTVWQYYIVDADHKPVIRRPIPFFADPSSIVPSGGGLIWRLVSILAGPNSPPNSVMSSLA